MKTNILLITFLIGISLLGYAQEEITEEINSINNTYIKIINNEYNKTYIYNKRYELMFRSMDAGPGWSVPLGKIENKRKMHEAVEKHMLPYIEKYINNMSDREGLIMGFLSELDGVVKEVTFYYPSKWNIPITVLEELEKELLSIPLTFTYNKTHPAFKKVTTVWRQYAYGKSRFTILRDQGARGIIDEEDLIRVPEEGGLTPLPGDEKPITDPDDRDSNPIHDDKDRGPFF